MEQTLVLLKPDAVQRGLIGEITHRFERKGFKLVGLKMITVDDAMLESHYAHILDKPFFGGMRKFMKSSPIIAMVWEGLAAVEQVRSIVGALHPKDSVPGTIRGDFAMSLPSNLIHASATVDEAKVEVERFFHKTERFSYDKTEYMHVYADEDELR